MHIGVFILLLLSGERNFGVRLNKPYTATVPMDIPVFTGKKKKKSAGLARWRTSVWMIKPGVPHRPRPAKKKIDKYYNFLCIF